MTVLYVDSQKFANPLYTQLTYAPQTFFYFVNWFIYCLFVCEFSYLFFYPQGGNTDAVSQSTKKWLWKKQ